ncbi:MAG: hypothetical protein WCS33_00335 [Candidatus Caldatribacteriota bacterium]
MLYTKPTECKDCMKESVCIYSKEYKELQQKARSILGDDKRNLFEVNISCREFFKSTNYRGDAALLSNFFNIEGVQKHR